MGDPILTTEEVRRLVDRMPRVDLAYLPTPLEEAPRFADAIGSGRLFVKRDDCTGGQMLAGNKTRHNEFILADALRQGADVLVWGAGTQSNNCRQTAAGCAKLGIDCRLYLTRATHDDDLQGNLLLDHLIGARVEIVDAAMGPEMDALLVARAEQLRAAGRKPYTWDRVHVQPLAAVSYILCLAEIIEEMRPHGLEPTALYVSSAGATGAGLALAKKLLGLKCAVRSICPIQWPWDVRASVAELASKAAALLGLPHRLRPEEIEANEEYIGPRYGTVTTSGREAMALFGRTEGILLDPVYTGKALAGLIADVRSRRLKPADVVVFVHTGGTPAVFAYRDELVAKR